MPGPVTGPGTTGVDGRVELVRHEERLTVSTETVGFQTVRFVRRVITETVTVPVVIRREVLDVEPVDLIDGSRLPYPDDGVPMSTSDITPQLVIELHEEIPVVGVQVQLTERIHVGTRTVVATALVENQLRAERIAVETAGTARPGVPPAPLPR